MALPLAEDKGRTGSNKEEKMKVQVESKLYGELGGLRCLVLAIIKQNGRTGYHFIARVCDCSESAARKAITDLKKLGYLDEKGQLTGLGGSKFWG